MADILTAICNHVRGVTADRAGRVSLAEIRALAESAEPPRDFRAALGRPDGVALIAEIKKASPSKGVLRADLDPAHFARLYRDAGADAISVLTEDRFFQGRPEYLRLARDASGLPVLRKDFLLEPYQIFEARALGADAVLLIVRALDDATLRDLHALATALRMTALVEVHDERELERAMNAGASVIGVNNRNLDTFVVDLDTTIRLAAQVDAGTTLVAESGIHAPGDVERVRRAGVHAILVGESIVTSADPGAKIRELVQR
ncbi:MAG: indole-3-glycerol phosphate synthase TrpC [Deltaproteobacteria bacterium]|nr:indole-3-glycerol phosphate synthase TrpC [Deltaproteobacteria bacterium]